MNGLFNNVEHVDNWLANHFEDGIHIWFGLNGDEAEYGMDGIWKWEELNHNWH